MTAPEKKSTTYTALTGFAVKGKVTAAGEECPAFDKDTTGQLLAMRRMAPSDSDEAKEVVKRIKERDARAEKDRKAAEAKARLPGAK